MNQQTAPIDKKAAQTGTMLRATGPDGTQAQLEFNPYAEDPRPNLFNIVKNTRDNKVHILFMLIAITGSLHASIVRGQAE